MTFKPYSRNKWGKGRTGSGARRTRCRKIMGGRKGYRGKSNKNAIRRKQNLKFLKLREKRQTNLVIDWHRRLQAKAEAEIEAKAKAEAKALARAEEDADEIFNIE